MHATRMCHNRFWCVLTSLSVFGSSVPKFRFLWKWTEPPPFSRSSQLLRHTHTHAQSPACLLGISQKSTVDNNSDNNRWRQTQRAQIPCKHRRWSSVCAASSQPRPSISATWGGSKSSACYQALTPLLPSCQGRKKKSQHTQLAAAVWEALSHPDDTLISLLSLDGWRETEEPATRSQTCWGVWDRGATSLLPFLPPTKMDGHRVKQPGGVTPLNEFSPSRNKWLDQRIILI